MNDLDRVLRSIQKALDGLESRVRQQIAQGSDPVISFSQRADRQAQANEVLVGFGRLSDPISEGTGIVLNNKSLPKISDFSDKIDCITDLVLTAPDSLLGAWTTVVDDDKLPHSFFNRFSFSVEDASPDSCFGLLCLMFRLNGIQPDDVPSNWVTYIRNWEMGKANSGLDPSVEYGNLHNALVHSNIQSNVSAAWIDGLRLMVAALGASCTPTQIIGIETREFYRARAFLSYEAQLYQESLRAITPLQLLVPMAGGEKHNRLVDAYIGIESIPLGSLKAFARVDQTHPFFKNGFAMMAIYRPLPESQGSEFTISADPYTGLDLTLLWEELERREDVKWRGIRPSSDPRLQMVGYPNGKRLDGAPSPNEPWYLNSDRTLVAAPRIFSDGESGTRLTWDDVSEALWAIYNPFRDVMVRPGAIRESPDHPLRLLHKCEAEDFIGAVSEQPALRRRLLIAGWHRRNNADQVFWRTPTLERYLAALVIQELSKEPVKVENLPPESAYDVVELSAGIAIITNTGAFFMASEQLEDEDVMVLRRQFQNAAELLAKIENSLSRVEPLFQSVKLFVEGNGKRRSEGDLDYLHQLAHEQFEITVELNKTLIKDAPPNADRFRNALLERWGVAGRLEALATAIDQVRAILQSHAELTAGRRFAFLQTYGVPLLIASAVVAVVPELSKEHWDQHLVKQIALAFVIVSLVGTTVIIAVSRFIDYRIRRRRMSALAAHRLQDSHTFGIGRSMRL